MLRLSVISSVICLALASADQDRIQHVVVLMEENRSFDHLLGFYKRINPSVDGLNGDECLPIDPSKPFGEKMCVNDNAKDECVDDPCHMHDCTTRQIYGFQKEETTTDSLPQMNGFLWDADVTGTNIPNRISMWKPENVPVIVKLAEEFALFDNFFSAHPGPTYPNRQFVHTGTALGEKDDEVPDGGFPQKTIYEKFLLAGHEFKFYYDGHQGMVWANFVAYVNTPQAKDRTFDMDQFYKDAASGNLPTYSFIEPRVFLNTSNTGPSMGLPNHQHPVSSVKEGERLYKNVYEALRNGPNWNNTLFILTYDEHGGFFDHVPPPQVGIPNPDGIPAKSGFNYERLGIRIPTLLMSPWIKKGTLIKAPKASQKPFSTSQWDLSSIPATMNKMFSLGDFLTKRDTWAATFENLFETLDEPRQDCPATLPYVPPSTQEDVDRFLTVPLDDHQLRVIANLCVLNGLEKTCGAHLKENKEAGEFTAALWTSFHKGSPLPEHLVATES